MQGVEGLVLLFLCAFRAAAGSDLSSELSAGWKTGDCADMDGVADKMANVGGSLEATFFSAVATLK